MTTLSTLTCPPGMTGLAVSPWSNREIYAICADWAQASCGVRVYGYDCWENDCRGRQVADFCHDPVEALKAIIEEAFTESGDEIDDAEVARILESAVSIREAIVNEAHWNHELGCYVFGEFASFDGDWWEDANGEPAYGTAFDSATITLRGGPRDGVQVG